MDDLRSQVRRWRALAILLGVAWLVALAIVGSRWQPEPIPFTEDDFRRIEVDRSEKLFLEPATFDDLPGWELDDLTGFETAFRRSCDVFRRQQPSKDVSVSGLAGKVGDWLEACSGIEALESGTPRQLRAFIETSFRPWRLSNRGRRTGLFTGYYESSLRGSRRRQGAFRVPLYGRPPELATVDLGAFREDLSGRKITGRVSGSTFVPFANRREIDEGALRERRLEIVWVDDLVDVFFLHIQGSGRVELEEGGELRVGYAGQNGHPYFAIGRELIASGEIEREKMSMQAIRQWLADHPEEVESLLQMNESYVFFRVLEGEGPLGSMGVAVTPGRSLAVDRNQIPLGVPLFLDSTYPVPFVEGESRPLRRLMVAQDTGGAIKGAIRGDVFWGHGQEAAEIAGRMKEAGSLWMLLPAGLSVPEEFLSGN